MRYVANLHGREPPKIIFMEKGWRRLNLHGEYSKAATWDIFASLKILKDFIAKLPVPGARAVMFIDDITVILPPEPSLNTAAIAKVAE